MTTFEIKEGQQVTGDSLIILILQVVSSEVSLQQFINHKKTVDLLMCGIFFDFQPGIKNIFVNSL